MKIVIPMSGEGRRFLDAGYRAPKPLIPVDGKPMIEHVAGMFPGETDFVFVCNEQHLADTDLRAVLQRVAPQGRIVAIAPHKRGPVHAVLQAAHLLGDDEPVLVNYCDFSVEWDWPQLKAQLAANGCDGAVPSYWGFQPHSLGSTHYAYSRVRDGWMQAIQEKRPYTAAPMDEPASSGSYYFRRGADLKRCFAELAADPALALDGEHYVSLAYRLLLRDGLKVWVPRVPVMLQWGTPEDLEDYQAWSDHFAFDAGWAPRRPFPGQALIPMAGEGKRFAEAGYVGPKPLLPVGGEPMVLKATASLPRMDRQVFVARSQHLQAAPLARLLQERFGAACQVVVADSPSEGQADSCLLARGVLDLQAPLMIGACDHGLVWDEDAFAALIADAEVDAVVWTFRGHADARRHPTAYSWAKADGQGRMLAVSVKAPVSGQPQRDPGLVGAFWFRRAADFVAAADALLASGERVNGEAYVDSAINFALAQGLRIRLFDVKRYLGWGTPDDLKTWEHWSAHFGRVPRGESRVASREG